MDELDILLKKLMTRQHPVLGTISASETNPQGVEAMISFAGRSIPIQIDPDDQTMEQAIEFASSIATALPHVEPEIKLVAVRDLGPLYNGGWNEFDQLQKDGTYKTVKNPKLSDEEFAAKLALESISITGTTCVEFWYDDANMFWGHGVFVSSLDGMDFSNANAELFG